jgi:outer membrane protein assembly factor BamB
MLCGVPRQTERFTVGRYDRRDDGGAAAVPLIDLDLITPPGPERSSRGRFARRPVLAWLAVAAVLAVAASGGSADAEAGRLDKVLTLDTVQDGQLAIASGAVFVATRNTDRNTEIRRRSLDGRGAEWSVSVPASVERLTIRPAAQVLLASVAGEGTTALDMRTGRVLWRNPTDHHLVSSDDVALLENLPTGEDGPPSIDVVDLRTGRTVWSHNAGPASEWLIDEPTTSADSPQFLVTVKPGGDVTTFRLADGAVVARRALRLPASEWGAEAQDDFTQVSADGDTLFHARRQGNRTSLAAYRLVTLEPMWRTEGGPVGSVSECGTVTCVNTAEAVSGLDPRTGAHRWTAAGWAYASARGGRLIAFAGEGSETVGVLDPETGRVAYQHRTGGEIEGSSRYFVREDVTFPGRLWVVDMGAGRLRARVLGRLTDTTTMPCAADGPYIACMSVLGGVDVWRVRPGA